jgi:hypothetical protein
LPTKSRPNSVEGLTGVDPQGCGLGGVVSGSLPQSNPAAVPEGADKGPSPPPSLDEPGLFQFPIGTSNGVGSEPKLNGERTHSRKSRADGERPITDLPSQLRPHLFERRQPRPRVDGDQISGHDFTVTDASESPDRLRPTGELASLTPNSTKSVRVTHFDHNPVTFRAVERVRVKDRSSPFAEILP